ncbi:glyoxalase [Bacillus sp. FJAT-27916]|uniref:VOC family protein n=1 Tax=Bacillaceae TaxID=186817 RepID=UPI0006708650|nr:VOC family protein [Bacillus sp. FJAT-27916]KMY45520.1 glyoxalase [Bacillus sp. FJAT-27916]
MNEKLNRVGTIYIPVTDPDRSQKWYVNHLGAELKYLDKEKAIVNLAGLSFFLLKASAGQSVNFTDINGEKRFILTFEVDGERALTDLREDFIRRKMPVGEIEDRGHAGRNFVFADLDGNLFDVWSELSPAYRKTPLLSNE